MLKRVWGASTSNSTSAQRPKTCLSTFCRLVTARCQPPWHAVERGGGRRVLVARVARSKASFLLPLLAPATRWSDMERDFGYARARGTCESELVQATFQWRQHDRSLIAPWCNSSQLISTCPIIMDKG